MSDSSALLAEFDVLIIPGRGNSGPEHWQSLLEARIPHARRVIQSDWDLPNLDVWANELACQVRGARKPVLAVAHSFGCLATVAAVTKLNAPIATALLVAPADPGRFNISASCLQVRLPLPSILVVSRNDPWMDHEAALMWAGQWGCEVLDLGPAGHINVESGHGPWAELDELLLRLVK